MQQLKKFINQNILLYDFIKRVKGIYPEHLTKRIVRSLKDIDSILEFETFKKQFPVILFPDIHVSQRGYGNNSFFYGHLYTLYRYANHPVRKKAFAMPAIEHGIDQRGMVYSKETLSLFSTLIFQGSYKKKQIHQTTPLKPVFVIGPYIHYARCIYSDEKLQQLKQEWGKTLLVFPFHCYEKSTCEYNEFQFVEYIMSVVASEFDTVLVSVYWNDLSSPLYNAFEEKGARLVSSGFRGDIHFLDRLKTLIVLSDGVCGNAFGTHIGYAHHLKKPYLHINTDLSYNEGSGETTNLSYYKDLTVSLNTLFNEWTPSKTKQKQQLLFCDKYWGSNENLKTPDEIEAIIQIGEKLFADSFGFTENFNAIVRDMLHYPEKISCMMYRQLKDATFN